MQVKVKKLREDAIMPEYKSEGASGFDLASTESFTLYPSEIIKVPLKGEELEEAKDKLVNIALASLGTSEKEYMIEHFGEVGLREAVLAQIPNKEEIFVKHKLKNNPVVVGSGLAFEIPEGYEIEIRGRSGLGINNDIEVFNGTIDSDYVGEVSIKLRNVGNKPIKIEKGERIAQGIIKKVEKATFVEADELKSTKRGTNGYGSTGRF